MMPFVFIHIFVVFTYIVCIVCIIIIIAFIVSQPVPVDDDKWSVFYIGTYHKENIFVKGYIITP